MKVAKQAVQYYTMITGNEWSSFYDKLDIALSKENPTGEYFIIKKLMDTVIKSGVSLNEFKMNKDAVKALFDNESRKQCGEFFTPIVWAKELYKYIDKFIPNWRTDFNIWENSCYSMDTEIFTKRGWVTYDNLLDDDEIYTLNPDTLTGEWSHFHSRFKKPFSGKMISIDGTDVDLLVTPDHRMFCLQRVNSRDTERHKVIVDAKSMYDRYMSYSATSKTATYRVVTSAKCLDNYLYDDSIEPHILERFGNNLSEFWYLIGLYIGDGGYYVNNKKNINALKFSFKKERKISILNSCLDNLGIDYSCYDFRDLGDDKCTFRINDLELVEFISSYIGFDKKRVPFSIIKTEYLSNLFTGLRETDDHVYTYKYQTANKDLVKDIEVLGVLLGYHFNVGTRTRKSASSDKEVTEYCINLSGKNTFGISRQMISEVDYNDYVWDLTTCNDNHIFLVRRNNKCCFSMNCGSGNLLRESKATMSNVYMSSLQEDDITLVKNTPEFKGVNAFQCDFLQGIDYDEYNTEFLDKLPPRLKEIIVNDEPLLLICNPPYKTGSSKATDVGRYMCDIGMDKPAYDIFYQFCWRVMRFVEMFNLKNCYYAFFGPLTFFTGANANILLKEFEHSFEFLDGMCISAQEFSDTSDSIKWGISGSVWKSRGGRQLGDSHKDILLEKKYLLPDGSVGCDGKVLYEPPREKLSDWVAPKDITFFNNAPLMTSHLTFKGKEVFEKEAPKSGKLADNALGTLMIGNTLTRSSDQSAILSMPSTIQYVSITKENFWRCVASYTFRRIYDANWAVAKKEISAPNVNVEGYDLWLKNALVFFLFEYKSMMSSLRGVSWGGYNNYIIRNKLFYLTEEEIRANCHDEVILNDLDKYPLENDFILEKIKECEPYWAPEVREFYDWCKNYTLSTYDKRKEIDYKGSLECADAGFQQLRTGGLWNDELAEHLTKIITRARDYMCKDLDKFGFVVEVEDSDL